MIWPADVSAWLVDLTSATGQMERMMIATDLDPPALAPLDGIRLPMGWAAPQPIRRRQRVGIHPDRGGNMKIRWPRLTFPPINLWTAPHQPALEDTMTATARDDDTVVQMLCLRNDELQAEKDALVAQVDRLEEQLAEAKRAQAIMRDAFVTQVQQAVSSARRDWAKEDKAEFDRLIAEKQADAVSEYASHYLGGHEQELAEIYAGKLRRQAEEH